MDRLRGMRAKDSILVSRMDRGFGGGKETRAENRAVGAKGKDRRQSAAITDSAGGDQRQVADSVAHLGNQRESRDAAAHMSACLETLGDDGVRAGFLGPAGFVGGATLPNHLDRRTMEP